MKSASQWPLLVIVLIAFAANSILCRLALKLSPDTEELLIDPASFTGIRLISGAIVLLALLYMSGRRFTKPTALHWRGALFLFVYAVTFSFAYIELDAAMGALILFGMVQVCIIFTSIVKGGRLSHIEWLGCGLAITGLLVLTLPHLFQASDSAVSVFPVVLMAISGIAWGLFTVNGASSRDSLFDAASCFVITVPAACILLLLARSSLLLELNEELNISILGFFIAVISGALASGMGYALWYKILPSLSSSQASTSQLLVPVIAAVGGSVFLDELLDFNFVVACVLTLGGVLLVIKATAIHKVFSSKS